MSTTYDCYKTPSEWTMFDFREAWNDYRGADGYSILGNRDFNQFMTAEVEELVDVFGSCFTGLLDIADELTKRHSEKYAVKEMHGCCQGDWQHIVYPTRFKDDIKYIEQEYFNLCDEWCCVPEGKSKSEGVYCFTYPFDNISTEEQLKNICMCDEVELHYPHNTIVWD